MGNLKEIINKIKFFSISKLNLHSKKFYLIVSQFIEMNGENSEYTNYDILHRQIYLQ